MPLQAPKVNNIHLEIDEEERTVAINFRAQNGVCKLVFKVIKPKLYVYSIICDGDEIFNFDEQKEITRIGKTNNCAIRKNLKHNMERYGIVPEGISPLQERIPEFLENIRTIFFKEAMKIDEFIDAWLQETKTESAPSWFEAINEVDYFSDNVKKQANELLLQNNFVEHVYDVIHLKVVAQKPKVILSFLIALSSVLDKPIHSVATGNPSKSKSTISETVFDIFPRHHRMEMEPGTKEAGLMNMTKFKEKNAIFKYKLIKLGDWGDSGDQESLKFLMAFFKVLMSEQKYTKILTDMQDEEGRATILKIDGCGSVQVQIVTPGTEKQFQSRSLVWSPDDNRYVQNAIRDHQEDELGKFERDHEYKLKRDIIAAAIDGIFKFVKDIRESGATFDIINPFSSDFNKLLNVDESPNANRDRPMIQALPKLVTLANCYRRDLFYHEGFDTYALIVTPKDYLYTVKNLGRTLSFFIHKKSEVLQSYIDVIETKLSKEILGNDGKFNFGDTQLYSYDELKMNFESPKPDPEFVDSVVGMTYHTYKDISRHTTANPKTVNRYMNELADLEIVYINKTHSPHRIYIPKDYDSRKKEAFDDIFDFERSMENKEFKEMDSKSMSKAAALSEIENKYDKTLEDALTRGWVKTPMSDSPICGEEL